jgi:hypothetical protein
MDKLIVELPYSSCGVVSQYPGIRTIELHGQMRKVLQIKRFWKTKAAGSRHQCILEFSIS